MSQGKRLRKVEAKLVTAVLCSVELGPRKHFKFCIPSGMTIDYEEMEMVAAENGVSEKEWLMLLDKIEETMDSLN